MSILTSPSPFTIATSRAKRLLDNIETKIQNGQISTTSDLLVGLVDGLQRFSNTLSEPSLTVPFMKLDEILIKQFVSDPVDEADEDCILADEQISITREITRQVFNTIQAEVAGIQQSLADNTSLMNELRLWISDSDSSFLWVGDSFNDTSKTDSASTVFVDTTAGTCVLQPDTATSLNSNIASITIDKKYSEGGIPGNNMEIRAPGKVAFTGEQVEPRPTLFRDTLPTPDDLTFTLDGNPDTWFEWERVYCIFPQPTIVARTSHVYDPGGKPFNKPLDMLGWKCFIQWPGDTDVDQGQTVTVQGTKKVKVLGLTIDKKKTHSLTKAGYPLAYFNNTDKRDLLLGVVIELNNPQPVSWLQITPFIRQNTYPQIDQILISPDGDQWRKILSTPTILNPRINRGVDFSQEGITSSAGFEGIGVFPLPKSNIKYIKILFRQANTYPTQLGIGHLYQVDRKAKHRVQPPVPVVGSFNSTPNTNSSSIDFSTSENQTIESTTQFFDILKADRQCIGIRDISLEQRTYKDTGQFISTPLQLSQPAKAVALLTTESVPQEWAPNTPNGKPWIYYEISADGSNWQTIIPQVAQLENSVVKFDAPVATLYFRATFSRPNDRPSETPVLYNYSLKVLP